MLLFSEKLKMRNEGTRLASLLFVVLLSASSAFAWPWSSKEVSASPEDQARIKDSLEMEEVKSLQREVETLTRIRLQKADSLEKLESAHWGKRYAESQLTEEHQTTTRELDGRYSKLSTDLGRVNEEVAASKGVTADAVDKADAEEGALDNLNTQVKLSIDKAIGDVTGDYPVGMNARLLRLKDSQAEADKKDPNTLGAARGFLTDMLERQKLTYTQDFGRVLSQVGSRPDVEVNRLRLGTIFLGEVAIDNGEVQTLLRSGNLQGKVFEWNNTLPPEMTKQVSAALTSAHENAVVTVPLDVLQNKALKNAIVKKKDLNWKEKLQQFFKSGGIVMYPLALVAIFAFLLGIERAVMLMIFGRVGRRFVKKVKALADEEKFDEAAKLCKSRNTSLSKVLYSVLKNARSGRETVEKCLQEALLREQPKLERRMGLLAAMGTIAPLLGLLGTVTGIITLFTVITEVGTNDARVLAGGISEALITTETGLIIAIPVMILHGLLSEKIEKVTSALYVQSISLLNQIFEKEKS